jgi:hypothetical protein
MPSTSILPYPYQLPQDYYNKNLPPGAPPITAEAPTAPSGGDQGDQGDQGGTLSMVWYGDTPPSSPINGSLWVNTQGQLFTYIDPGLWSQIGTNW